MIASGVIYSYSEKYIWPKVKVRFVFSLILKLLESAKNMTPSLTWLLGVNMESWLLALAWFQSWTAIIDSKFYSTSESNCQMNYDSGLTAESTTDINSNSFLTLESLLWHSLQLQNKFYS